MTSDSLDPVLEKQKVTRLDYRLKLCYQPNPNLPSTIIDLTGLIEHGIIHFQFDIADEGEKYPRVKDSKLLIETVMEDINGEW